MSHIKARVVALGELIDELKNAETIFERAAIFAAARALINDLNDEERLNGYAKEKLHDIRWHIGAALGFDETNGQTLEQHRVWALGYFNTLQSESED
jgi:hypothetical protein